MSAKLNKREGDTSSQSHDDATYQSGGESPRKSEDDAAVKPERDTALGTGSDSAIKSICDVAAQMTIGSPQPTSTSDAESSLPKYTAIYLSGVRPKSSHHTNITWHVASVQGLAELGDALAEGVNEIFNTHKDLFVAESHQFLNATWTGRGEAQAEGEALTQAFTEFLVKDWGEFGPRLATRLSTRSTNVTVDCKL